MKHRIQALLFIVAVSVAAAVPAAAQDAAHKPGGLNKVAHNVSNTMKKAGRDSKAALHRDASKTHHALTDAGNDSKTALKKATGIHGSHNAHPGGLNKVARDISHASKKTASKAKAAKNRAKSQAHAALTEAGKSVKDTTLRNARP